MGFAELLEAKGERLVPSFVDLPETVAFGGGVGDALEELVAGELAQLAAREAATVVLRLEEGHAEGPGAKVAGGLELVALLPEDEAGLLHQVLGGGCAAREGEQKGAQPRAVRLEETLELGSGEAVQGGHGGGRATLQEYRSKRVCAYGRNPAHLRKREGIRGEEERNGLPDLLSEGLAWIIGAMRWMGWLRALLVLGRVSNLPTVWTNVMVGWFLSGGGWTLELAWVVAGMSLLYVAGMTLNDAFDVEWDRQHAPSRPIPSGTIGIGAVWCVGVAELLAGVAVLLALTTTHPLLAAGLVAAIWLYDRLHKRWTGSVWIMGLCRALVYLGAGSAVAAHTRALEVPNALWILAVGAVLYIAGLTLAARSERLEGRHPLRMGARLLLMLPVVFPLVASRGMERGIEVVALSVVGVTATTAWLAIVRRALAERVPKGVAFAIAGIALYDAAVVSFADWRAAVLCLTAFVLTLGLQRIVPAT